MAYPDDDTTPYWASTVPVLGLDDGRPKGPLDLPLEFLLSGQFARAISEASNPRIPHDLMPFPYVPSLMPPLAPPMGDWSSSPSLPTPDNISAGFASPPAQLPPSIPPAPPVEHLDAVKYWGASPALPEVPPPSPARGFYVSPLPQAPSWDSVPQPADNAAQSSWPPPSAPSWDVAVPPVGYPDLARYWSALPAPSGASAQPPTAPPTWLPTAEWKPPEAAPRLSFSGSDRAPGIERSWDHLWPTESPVPKTWHQRSLDALHRLDEALWYVTPPELRPKVAAAVQFLKSIAPGSGTADSMEAGTAAEAARREGRYGAYAGNLASGMFNAASDWFPALKAAAAPAAKALLVGGSAISPAKRELAEEMEKKGKSAVEIWRETRLERGPDRQWLTEIPDTGYRIMPAGRDKRLFEHHVHPAAMETFPELGQIKSHLRIRPRMGAEGKSGPGFIEVRAPDLEVAKRVGLEELTHTIDRHTRHPRGGSSLEFQNMTDYGARQHYLRQAGEVRADNVLRRLLRTEEERAAIPPSLTQRLPYDQQIVRYHDR
jgi:hypothetical protein